MARADRIKFPVPVNPLLVANALLKVQTALDEADAGNDTTVYGQLQYSVEVHAERDVWMRVAILLADTAEIDSQTLSALRHSVHKGTQDALFG